jgi:hypothetical protein
MFYGVRLLASRPTPVNFVGTYDFLLGFTTLAKGSSFKALKTRPLSHSHLLHNPLCTAPGPPPWSGMTHRKKKKTYPSQADFLKI